MNESWVGEFWSFSCKNSECVAFGISVDIPSDETGCDCGACGYHEENPLNEQNTSP